MKKMRLSLWVGLMLLSISTTASAMCTNMQLKIFGIDVEKYNEAVEQAPSLEDFKCYEIKYLLNAGRINATESDYENELDQVHQTYFPNENIRISKLRELGTPADIMALGQAAVKLKDYKTTATTIKKTQEAIKNLAMFEHNIVFKEGTLYNRESINPSPCMPKDVYKQLNADFPEIQKVGFFDSSKRELLDSALRSIGTIKKEMDTVSGNTYPAIITINEMKYRINWHKSCEVEEVGEANANMAGTISKKIATVFFTQMSKGITATYRTFSDIGLYLLGLFLGLWLVMYVAKGYVNLELESDFTVPKLIDDFVKLLMFILIYTTFLIGDSPQLFISTFINPVLEIGATIGQTILTVVGGEPMKIVPTNNPESLFSGTEQYIIYLIEEIQRVSFDMIYAGWVLMMSGFKTFFAGFILVILFGWVTLKYLYIIVEVFFKLFMVLLLMPFLGLAWVFPNTRGYAKKGIDYVFEATYTCAYLPLLIVFQSFLMSNFLSGGSDEKMQTLRQGIEARDAAMIQNGLFFESFTFWEAIVIGGMMIYMMETMQDKIKEFTQASWNTELANRVEERLKKAKSDIQKSEAYKKAEKGVNEGVDKLKKATQKQVKATGRKIKKGVQSMFK